MKQFCGCPNNTDPPMTMGEVEDGNYEYDL